MREREKTNHHKNHKNHRKGCEFSEWTKFLVRQRADGLCECPNHFPCPNFNNDRPDHVTGIFIGRLLGMDKETIKSEDNCQLLCDPCEDEKYRQERYFQRQMLDKLSKFDLARLGYKGNRSSYGLKKAA